jgi:hypothetical protein
LKVEVTRAQPQFATEKKIRRVGQQTGSPVGQAKLQARGIECKIERMKGRKEREWEVE